MAQTPKFSCEHSLCKEYSWHVMPLRELRIRNQDDRKPEVDPWPPVDLKPAWSVPCGLQILNECGSRPLGVEAPQVSLELQHKVLTVRQVAEEIAQA
jgi:hypothetical protein